MGEMQDRARELYEEGMRCLDRGLTDEALERFERALELDPCHAPSHNKIGVIHANRGDLDEAARHFARAVECDPGYAPAQSNMGNIHYNRGDYDRAIEQYNLAIRLDPDYQTAYNNLAAAYKKTGQVELAVKNLKKAQRLRIAQSDQEARDRSREAGKRFGCLGVIAAGLAIAGLLALL